MSRVNESIFAAPIAKDISKYIIPTVFEFSKNLKIFHRVTTPDRNFPLEKIYHLGSALFIFQHPIYMYIYVPTHTMLDPPAFRATQLVT